MSHTTTVKSVAIRDVEALRSAVKELQELGVNCSLEEGDNIAPRMYYDQQSKELRGKTPYVLRLPNSRFDLGFQRVEENGEVTYAPVTDFHGGYVEKEIGAKCGCKPAEGEKVDSAERAIGHMMQLYAKHATINAAVASGYTVDSITTDADTGEIHININAESYAY